MRARAVLVIGFLLFPFLAGATGSRIYAARVGTDGTVLTSAFEVSANPTGVQSMPRVAYFNGVFLLVWQDSRNGNGAILGTRISTNGKVLDATPLVFSKGTRSQVLPDVDADDAGFMVVWHGFNGTDTAPSIYASHIGTTGAPGAPVIVLPGADPRIAWNGTYHLIVYSSATGSHASQITGWKRMTKAGLAVATPTGAADWLYAEGAGPNDYSVCARPGGGWTFLVHANPPDPWGHSFAAERVVNLLSDSTIDPTSPTWAVRNTRNWEDSNTTFPANWLDANKDPVTLKFTKEAPWAGNAIAADATYNVAVWQHFHLSGVTMGNSDILASRLDGWQPVDAYGGVGVATDASAEEKYPALVGNGAGAMLVAYEKMVNGSTQIMGRVLTVGNSISVGSEVTIRSDKSGETRRARPAVAYAPANGGEPAHFLVVWQEGWWGEG